MESVLKLKKEIFDDFTYYNKDWVGKKDRFIVVTIKCSQNDSGTLK